MSESKGMSKVNSRSSTKELSVGNISTEDFIENNPTHVTRELVDL